MKSPEVFHDNKNIKGFTLIEMLLVVALMLTVGVFMFPVGISFYRAQIVDETIEGIESALRRAQVYAISGKGDSTFGVLFTMNSYTLFEGENYAERIPQNDQFFTARAQIEPNSFNEIVFSAEGTPSNIGQIQVSSGEKSGIVTILSGGVIE